MTGQKGAVDEASAWFAVPFGWVRAVVRHGRMHGVEVLPKSVIATGDQAPNDPVLTAFSRQLAHYLDRPATGFRLPLEFGGTPFQRRIWQALSDIPPGQTETYARLAKRLGSGSRAVAGACKANPLAIIIPCHRVVSTHGLGGYCGQREGSWLDIKRWLLAHEAGGTLQDEA